MSLSTIRQTLSGTRAKRFVLIALATVCVAVVVAGRYGDLVRDSNQSGETGQAKSAIDRSELDFGRALELLERGEYRLSIALFEEVDVKRKRTCAACRNNVGIALMRLGQPVSAENHFLLAVGLAPEVELYRNNLAWSRGNLQRPHDGSVTTLKSDKSAIELERAVNQHPSEENLRALVVRLIAGREYERAAQPAKQLLTVQPSDPTALVAIALADMGMGRIAAAEAQLNRLAEGGRDLPQAIAAAGEVARARGKIESRIQNLSQQAGRFWHDAKRKENDYYRIGLDYAALGDYARSATAYERASAVAGGGCARCENNLGFAYMRLERYLLAAEAFQTAVNLAPGEQLYKNNLDWARRALKQASEESR